MHPVECALLAVMLVILTAITLPAIVNACCKWGRKGYLEGTQMFVDEYKKKDQCKCSEEPSNFNQKEE